MVPSPAGFLLQHHGQGLHHNTTCHGSAGATSDDSTHSFPHATAHTATHTTTHAATHTTAHSATHPSSAFGSCGPIQLRCGR